MFNQPLKKLSNVCQFAQMPFVKNVQYNDIEKPRLVITYKNSKIIIKLLFF